MRFTKDCSRHPLIRRYQERPADNIAIPYRTGVTAAVTARSQRLTLPQTDQSGSSAKIKTFPAFDIPRAYYCKFSVRETVIRFQILGMSVRHYTGP